MRPFPSLVLALLPALVAPAAFAVPSGPTGSGGPDPDSARPDPWSVRELDGPDDRPDDGSRQRTRLQTSDGVEGPIARPRQVAPREATDTSVRRQWQVAPGITGITWDENDERGPIRASLLTVDWTRPGLTIDYGNAGPVQRTAPLSTMVRRDRAIAGINGDFFDIGDTGAPLGVGRDRQRGLLHGRSTGWNSAFSFSRSGVPEIGRLEVVTTIKQRPGIAISHVNAPSIAADAVGVYTPAWGRTSGNRVVDGQTRDLRLVVVRDGTVVRNVAPTRLPSDTKIRGRMLIGRGDGAAALRRLTKGSKATLVSRLAGAPAMAITGNQFLIDDGLVRVVDDREMHPRTAIGIDRDTNRLLLLVIDGRQRFSRGFTMVELAEMMMDLGADEALNLDGGGSSTMIARGPDGTVSVVNSPSDGVERSVANAITIGYANP